MLIYDTKIQLTHTSAPRPKNINIFYKANIQISDI